MRVHEHADAGIVAAEHFHCLEVLLLAEAEPAEFLRQGETIDAELAESEHHGIGDHGVAVDLHGVDMRIGERLDLVGHFIGRRLLVGRERRIREQQFAFEFAEEERLGEADVGTRDELLDLLFLFRDLLRRQSHRFPPDCNGESITSDTVILHCHAMEMRRWAAPRYYLTNPTRERGDHAYPSLTRRVSELVKHSHQPDA